MSSASAGALEGVKVVEIGGVGPGPYCAMYLADLGAEVIRIDRQTGEDALSQKRASLNLLARGKRSIAMDIRRPEGRDVVLRLVEHADVVIEGFRPGVLERLGLGPEQCLGANPALIYGRMTGWGSGGPLSASAGHDINYLGLAGILHAVGPRERPVPPLNLVGDFGGAMYLVSGILAALLNARRTGRGQIVEASILGGALALSTQIYSIFDHGEWVNERESNWMDGGAPFYRTYETRDGKFMCVGAIEAKFYSALVSLLELEGQVEPARQFDRATWPHTAERFAAAFRTRTRDEWSELAAGVEACCSPVLDWAEARRHPHNTAVGSFAQVGEQIEPAPAPKFSGTPSPLPRKPSTVGGDGLQILREAGLSDAQVATLVSSGIVDIPPGP